MGLTGISAELIGDSASGYTIQQTMATGNLEESEYLSENKNDSLY